MDELPYRATLEQRVRSWLREHAAEHRSPLTGRVMRGALFLAAAEQFGIAERSAAWHTLVEWCLEEVP